jgi:hypothetical protein
MFSVRPLSLSFLTNTLRVGQPRRLPPRAKSEAPARHLFLALLAMTNQGELGPRRQGLVNTFLATSLLAA